MKKTKAAEKWFSKRRLGLFIHWGIYAVPGWHEQMQWRKSIPRAEYGKLMHKFNPSSFNPGRWIDLAKETGMEYIVFTAKHHDGFCMWNTRETDFNIMNSPFKKDILQMLAKECRRQRFPLGIYYSVGDWHHPNYPNQGRSHELPGPEKGDEPGLKKYLAYLKAQVRELCTRYGPICEFWWDSNQTEHTDPSINKMIRSLQPKAVINNRGFDEGDFGTPERESKKGAGELAFPRPMEACNSTGAQSWGYKSDEDYYSMRHLIKSIDSIMARGGNYLLNVGPKADGTVPQASKKILKSIGKWYKSVKESFSGDLIPDMRGSGLKIDNTLLPELFKTPGVLTAKKGRVFYMHLNEFPKSEALVLNPVMEAPKKAVLLNTGKEVQFGLDFIPSLWAFKGRRLRVRKLPVNRLSNEVIVLKMNF